MLWSLKKRELPQCGLPYARPWLWLCAKPGAAGAVVITPDGETETTEVHSQVAAGAGQRDHAPPPPSLRGSHHRWAPSKGLLRPHLTLAPGTLTPLKDPPGTIAFVYPLLSGLYLEAGFGVLRSLPSGGPGRVPMFSSVSSG